MATRVPESPKNTRLVSIGIFAWNEEKGISRTLKSLLGQSLFRQLEAENFRCEILCVVNGCSDRTPDIAAEIFSEAGRTHPHHGAIQARVANIPVAGKFNAWNQFVHSLSASEAEFLVMMDADILFEGEESLWKLLQALRENSTATVAIDRPMKDILKKDRPSVRDRFSLGASQTTNSAPAQLCAQLYCVRSRVARQMYLPKDLPACEDGFIKALVTSDFLTQESSPDRICVAPGAGHTFEAYTSIPTLIRNQKRQVMGQTVVHILIDRYLPTLPVSQRLSLAETLRQKDTFDPDWLRQLVRNHLAERRFFWRLYPQQIGLRLRRLALLKGSHRITALPAAFASLALELIGGYLGWSALRKGYTQYWPAVDRARQSEAWASGTRLSTIPNSR